MDWISIKDRLPTDEEIIVAIMQGRIEMGGDPIEDANIIILRNWGDEWRTMDTTGVYYLSEGDDYENNWEYVVNYWVPWQDFGLPQSMITKDGIEKLNNHQKNNIIMDKNDT